MPMTRPSTPPVAILLAGGLGTRFDAAGRRNKLLTALPGDPLNRPVALASAHALLAVLPRVIAVVRPDSTDLENILLQAGCRSLYQWRLDFVKIVSNGTVPALAFVKSL